MVIINSESERKLTTDILITDPDAGLRDRISTRFNGYYTTIICRKCEKHYISHDGNIATCRIVELCKDCMWKESEHHFSIDHELQNKKE